MDPQPPTLDSDALALRILACTQQAALACLPHVGRGDGKRADAAAVAAMRAVFEDVPGRGTVVIGEGEKDDAPMLYIGEEIGTGTGATFDLAVDPLENTTACAKGGPGAIAVASAAPGGSMWGSPGWYMDKLVVGAKAAGVIDITAPMDENLKQVASALGKSVDELVVVVLDKPRHQDKIARLHELGVCVQLIADGDVEGSLRVLLPERDGDLLLGVGGAPEGVLSACAAHLLGGDMVAALAPRSDEERALIAGAGQEEGAPLSLLDLVSDPACCFVATAVTPGALLPGPTRGAAGWHTHSFVSSPLHRRLVVDAVHTDGALPDTPEERP